MTAFDTADQAPPAPPPNLIGLSLGEWLRELIWTGQATRPRSLQVEVGMSEVGTICDRELTYKLNGTRKVNVGSDPMASMVGTGLHHVIAEDLKRMDPTGRWLIEMPIDYKGIPGSLDAFDTRRNLLLDWKSTSKANLRKIRLDGPPWGYVVQANLYAAALRERGFTVNQAALVYLARDGKLDDLYVCPVQLDPAIADKAIARVNQLLGTNPADAQPTPSRLCGYCNYHLPGSTDHAVGCPGA